MKEMLVTGGFCLSISIGGGRAGDSVEKTSIEVPS
jgi:hypothetical protein